MTVVDPKLIGDIQAVVNVLRQTVSDWESLVRAVEALTRDHTRLRARCEEVERENEELRGAYDRLRQEHEGAVRALNELRSVHEALSLEHEASARAVRDLHEQHEAALRDRQSAASELEAILRRLQVPSDAVGAGRHGDEPPRGAAWRG